MFDACSHITSVAGAAALEPHCTVYKIPHPSEISNGFMDVCIHVCSIHVCVSISYSNWGEKKQLNMIHIKSLLGHGKWLMHFQHLHSDNVFSILKIPHLFNDQD